mgnify:CR=1 FL=1
MKTGEDLSDWRHEDEDHSSGRKSESAWFFQYAGGQFYPVKVIDAAHADIHPCIGCIHCGYEGPCVQKDDVEKFRQDILEAHYKTLVHYLNLKDMGMVLGKGCGTPSMTQHSKYPEQAYELGKKLK